MSVVSFSRAYLAELVTSWTPMVAATAASAPQTMRQTNEQRTNEQTNRQTDGHRHGGNIGA